MIDIIVNNEISDDDYIQWESGSDGLTMVDYKIRCPICHKISSYVMKDNDTNDTINCEYCKKELSIIKKTYVIYRTTHKLI